MSTLVNEKQNVNSLVEMWITLWRMCKTYVFPQADTIPGFFSRIKLEYFFA